METFGDPAFSALFRTEFPRLVGALTLAAGDREVAMDAVQDAFVQAYRHWRRVRSYDDPAAWVRRVALNRLTDAHRKRRREASALPRLWSPALDHAHDDTIEIVQAVQDLPPRQRLAVCLYYVADLSVDAIADAMGITAGTVKSQLHDARTALQASTEVHPS